MGMGEVNKRIAVLKKVSKRRKRTTAETKTEERKS